ncbi:unnamed protein product, partial [Rotaria sordida]
MLREYIGDGCAHSAMLEIDNQGTVACLGMHQTQTVWV